MVLRIKLAVFAAADRTDSLVRAVCCAAVAIFGFRMAGVTLTDSGVGLFIAVLRPSAPVVVQRIAGEEGRLIRRALGAQPADCAGLVVARLFGSGCSRLRILRLCFFCREAVCFQCAIGLTAVVADGLLRAGRRAAGVRADGDILGNAKAVALRRRDRGDKAEAGFSR